MSVKILAEFIEKGEDENKLLSMVVYQFRTLIIIKDLIERGKPSGRVASEAKLNPYVVQKSLPIVKKYSLPELVKFYNFLYQLDLKIKTGQIEPAMAIDFVVAR
jgi:DNA polymerase-3 subunit delta